jgi:hypothetical protein
LLALVHHQGEVVTTQNNAPKNTPRQYYWVSASIGLSMLLAVPVFDGLFAGNEFFEILGSSLTRPGSGLTAIVGVALLLYTVVWPHFDSTFRTRICRVKALIPCMVTVFLNMLCCLLVMNQGNFDFALRSTYVVAAMVLWAPGLFYGLVTSSAEAWWCRRHCRGTHTQKRARLRLAAWLAALGASTAVPFCAAWQAKQDVAEVFLSSEFSNDEIRRRAHNLLGIAPCHHDAVMLLEGSGNEESVPLLLNALRLCNQFVHACDSLRMLTNQNLGDNYQQWRRWYKAQDQHRREEWVAQGFRQAGRDVTSAETYQDVSSLLSLLGQADTPSPAQLLEPSGAAKLYNALFLMESFYQSTIRSSLEQLTRHGTVDQRRGVAVWAQRDCLGPSWGRCYRDNPIELVYLEVLRQDEDSSVRLWAERGLLIDQFRRTPPDERGPPRDKIERASTTVPIGERFEIEGGLIVSLHEPRDEPERRSGDRCLLQVHEADSGNLRYERNLRLGHYFGVSLAQGRRGELFIASKDVTLAIRLVSGQLLWKRAMGGSLALVQQENMSGKALAFAPAWSLEGMTRWLDPGTGEFVTRPVIEN